jgi:hypothetical protein
MRGIPRPLRHEELWRFRVLGAIVPGFDDIVAAEREKLPTPACPIIPLHLRPGLLAGVAIVERTGPEMLRMLRDSHHGGQQNPLQQLCRQYHGPNLPTASALANVTNLRIR